MKSVTTTGISQGEVRRLFEYKDGKLITKVAVGAASKVGSTVGCLANGYLIVKIKQRSYLVHRVIWLWHHGYTPENVVDHIDKNKLNNRIENLREVSVSCNLRNTKQRTSSSMIKGVSWNSRTKKWCAFIYVGGRNVNLGASQCLLEAVCHRLAAEQCLGWESCERSSPAKQYVTRQIPSEGLCA